MVYTQAIIGFNKIAFYPSVVDQNGNVRYLDEEELVVRCFRLARH